MYVGAADMQEPDRAVEQLVDQLPRLFPNSTPAWIVKAAFALGEVKQTLVAGVRNWDDETKRKFIQSAISRGMFQQLQSIAMTMAALA